jgi:hypothetical protein
MIAALPEWVGALARDLGVVAGILTALAVIYRMAVKPTLDVVGRIQRSVEAVEAELRPNGGSSLRDAIDRLEKQHESLATRIDFIDLKLNGK